MKTRRYSLVLALMLAHAGIVCADLAVVPASSGKSIAAVAVESGIHSEPVVESRAWTDVTRTGLLDDQAWALLPIAADSSESPAIRELPGLPNSSSLFLSAMLSVGAWHMVRRAGDLHLASLPAWYHSDAPYQIGHSLAFDPVAGFDFLPVCIFATPVKTEPARFHETGRESSSRRESQHFLTIESPRAPPAVS